MALTFEQLRKAVQSNAAIRRRRRLQPAGGKGDKIFPPTYPADERGAPPRHVYETRRVDGADVVCVLIDSVQAQANRFEEALERAAEEGRISLPRLYVDFAGTGLNSVEDVSVLRAPHRIFDAILRDSSLGGKKFGDSDLGQAHQDGEAARCYGDPRGGAQRAAVRLLELHRRGRRPRRQVRPCDRVGDHRRRRAGRGGCEPAHG